MAYLANEVSARRHVCYCDLEERGCKRVDVDAKLDVRRVGVGLASTFGSNVGCPTESPVTISRSPRLVIIHHKVNRVQPRYNAMMHIATGANVMLQNDVVSSMALYGLCCEVG